MVKLKFAFLSLETVVWAFPCAFITVCVIQTSIKITKKVPYHSTLFNMIAVFSLYLLFPRYTTLYCSWIRLCRISWGTIKPMERLSWLLFLITRITAKVWPSLSSGAFFDKVFFNYVFFLCTVSLIFSEYDLFTTNTSKNIVQTYFWKHLPTRCLHW